jgi:uncharacterized membrane protein required for colicin V production
MGLDIALGVVVLLAGIRGWLKGFVRQAIGLGALVGCVYLADPIRDYVRPHTQAYFPSIRPELFDKLLWWVAAVLAYIVSAGLAIWVVKLYRRRPYGDPELHRADQGAGFTLGLAKGVILGVFLTAGILKYEPTYSKFVPTGWIDDTVKASVALDWSRQWKPADRIWNSMPVQAFVGHVWTRGLWVDEPKSAEKPPVQAAAAPSAPKTLQVPKTPEDPIDPASPDFLRQLDNAIRHEGIANSR